MSKRRHDSLDASEQRQPNEPSSRPLQSDQEDGHISKAVAVEHSQSTMMQCSLPPHTTTLRFSTPESFETHYIREHTHRCSSCGKNFPSGHFLALHLDEAHNPLRELLAARGEKTYSCFVQGCERRCSTPAKRRRHLIDKHEFPTFYNFRIVVDGIDKSTSLLREGQKRRVSITADLPTRHPRRVLPTLGDPTDDRSPQGIEENSTVAVEETTSKNPLVTHPATDFSTRNTKNMRPDDGMGALETALSALNFIPRSVRSRQAKQSLAHQKA